MARKYYYEIVVYVNVCELCCNYTLLILVTFENYSPKGPPDVYTHDIEPQEGHHEWEVNDKG